MIPQLPRVTLPPRSTLLAAANTASRGGIAVGGGLLASGFIGISQARAVLMLAGAATMSASLMLQNELNILRSSVLEVPPEAHDAMNILTVDAMEPEHEELMKDIGLNLLNVTDHLMDVVTGRAMNPAVREAVSRAGADPEQIIRNLLALVEQDPPILSQRPTSRAQPAAARVSNPHDAV
jgi:hypothetical protein